MKYFLATALLLAGCASVHASPPTAVAPLAWPVATHDVMWDSPSTNATGSMPLGNGDIGLNVWVEPSGDLVILVGKSDSFDEFNRLLKVGRLRVKTTPALVQPGRTFLQTLRLEDGSIEIKTGDALVRVWVDANNPIVQVDVTGTTPRSVQVLADNWRKENRELNRPIQHGEGHSARGNFPDKKRVNADTVLAKTARQIGWCHHNVESQWKKNLEHTALGAEVARGTDPILDRSFGALVRASGCAAVSDTELKTTEPTTAFKAQILCVTSFADSPEIWRAQTEKKWAEVEAASTEARFAAHAAWWHDFWNRSWIDINADAKAQTISRAYALQRFVTACAGRGPLPIKFNGSLFTVTGTDPDFRAWGGAYWFQNTREAYWAMPYAGDYEEMLPLFAMYKNALPLREAASRKYYGHAGAFFPETMYFWGNYVEEDYGYDRRNKPDGLTDNPYIRRYWSSGLELVAMMLDVYDGTQDAEFRDRTLLPLAKSITTFFDQHWARKNGKILFEPAQSLETWHSARNPLPEIAGLRFVLPRLLALPADEATKAQWRKTLADLPPVPTLKNKNGTVRIAAADAFGPKKRNCENPELYGVFPYRLYTALAGGNLLEQSLNAWRVRLHPQDIGWQQNCIQAALLGLTAEAKAMVEKRAASTAADYRFPGFFGPNYDWTPEQCHGANMQTALQRMLMQCEGDRIVLLPAWPKEWNASFKLHAPQNTTVEGRVENGKVVDLKVKPESRSKDVEVK